MKKFIFLIREDLRLLKQMTPEQSQADIEQMVSWVEEITQAGNFIQGDPLENEIAMIEKGKIYTDGPFIESKEAISGYTIIKAASLMQAAEIAATCPLVQGEKIKIEVRAILEF